MGCKKLINLLSRYNQQNIIASLSLNPKQILFIIPEGKRYEEIYEEVSGLILGRMPNCEITGIMLRDQEPKLLEQIIMSNISEDTVLNITGGTRLISAISQHIALKNNIDAIYVDMENQRLLDVNNDFKILNDIIFELSIEELVCCSGGDIIRHSSDFFSKQEYLRLLDYIVNNYDMWLSIKEILRNNRKTFAAELQPLHMQISTRLIRDYDVNYLRQFLTKLQNERLIANVEYNNEGIGFIFQNREVKSFIMMAGSWLEALTYKVIRELREIYDIKSGVLFVWNDDELQVQNELDVVAAKDSKLICISCKDTNGYDIEALNELDVYAEQLGGNEVVKILIATERPEREDMIFKRAKEMDIDIVIFNGDIEKLRIKLQSLL